MKKSFATLFCMGLLSCSATAALAAKNETIDQAIAKALQYHPSILAEQERLNAETEGVDEVRAGLFPVVTLDASAGYAHRDDSTVRDFNLARTGREKSGNDDIAQGRIALNQLLFDRAGTTNRVEAAEKRAQAASLSMQIAKETIALQTAQAFMELARTQAQLDLAEKHHKILQAYYKNIQAQNKEGVADSLDVHQAKERLSLNQTTVLDLREQYRKALASYAEVTGATPPANALTPQSIEKKLPQNFDRAVETGLQKSPEIMNAQLSYEALNSEAEGTKSAFYPRLDAELSYTGLDQSEEFGEPSNEAQALVKLSWQFSTSGGQYATHRKAQFQAEEGAARRDELAGLVKRDISNNMTELDIAQKQIALLTERKQLNYQLLDNAIDQFEGGQRSALQLMDIESRVFEASLAHWNGIFRKLNAEYKLLASMGMLSEHAENNTKTGDDTL